MEIMLKALLIKGLRLVCRGRRFNETPYEFA